VPTIRADLRKDTAQGRAISASADEECLSCLAVMQKDIRGVSGVAGDEIGGP
jgi:hypothetical protein